jgi:actin-like ATPase involved in cell morphogenesis
MSNGIGADMGTYNIVMCRRNSDNNFSYKREVNAFLEMPLDNRFVFNMMKSAGVPLIEQPEANIAYALGEAAVNMAYTMTQIELKRPMKDGCLNPKEKYAQQIMNVMCHSLIGEIEQDNTTLYYSVPANAINQETDADYHSKVLEAMFKSYRSEKGFKVDPHPINEALALVYAELQNKAWTGIGVSAGAGMVNICYAMYGAPIFQFSIVNSGDWIDKMASKALGEETTTYVNREKIHADLTIENPDTLVQRAIKTQYEIMIQHTISGLKKGIEEAGNKARSEQPIDIVIAGGTSMPKGFDVLFRKILDQAKITNLKIGNVIRPEDPLFSVARGCLIAAENAK